MTLEELAQQQLMYQSKDICAVCHGRLETVFYGFVDHHGQKNWFCKVENEDDESKTLKRCTRCGLLYAK